MGSLRVGSISLMQLQIGREYYFSPAVYLLLLFCTLFELLTDFFTLRSCMLGNLYAPLLSTYFIVVCIARCIKSGCPCAIVVSVCTVDLCKLSVSLHQCHQDKSLYIYLQSTSTAILKKMLPLVRTLPFFYH